MIGGQKSADHCENVSEVIEVGTVEQSRRFELCVSEIYSIFTCFSLRKFVKVFIKDRGTVKVVKICNGKGGNTLVRICRLKRGGFVSFLSIKS